MDNPYRKQPDRAFWRRAMTNVASADIDVVTDVPFRITREDRVATAGSCFAQHISRTLVSEGFRYLVTEAAPRSDGAVDEGYGVYPARFGNLYTVQQLMQLFERAYGLFEPVDRAWRREDGRFVDPFRPQIQRVGFATVEQLEADRKVHLGAVREMFETCDVFVFTLGLTEGWRSTIDGAVFPVAPGVVAAAEHGGAYEFHNFDVDVMTDVLSDFIRKLRIVSPRSRIVLTVSPVPLVATYEDRHVLVATTYSKSALRVVAELVRRAHERVAYFPSYEIITGPHARYFEEDLRSVSPAGVAHVMRLFARHFLRANLRAPVEQPTSSGALPVTDAAVEGELRAAHRVICEEELLDEQSRRD